MVNKLYKLYRGEYGNGNGSNRSHCAHFGDISCDFKTSVRQDTFNSICCYLTNSSSDTVANNRLYARCYARFPTINKRIFYRIRCDTRLRQRYCKTNGKSNSCTNRNSTCKSLNLIFTDCILYLTFDAGIFHDFIHGLIIDVGISVLILFYGFG